MVVGTVIHSVVFYPKISALVSGGQAFHVPLLIKRAGQAMRRDHDAPVHTESILRGFVSDAAAIGIDDRVEARR